MSVCSLLKQWVFVVSKPILSQLKHRLCDVFYFQLVNVAKRCPIYIISSLTFTLVKLVFQNICIIFMHV